MLLNEGGLSLDNWQTDLENATQPSDFDVLLSFIKLHTQIETAIALTDALLISVPYGQLHEGC